MEFIFNRHNNKDKYKDELKYEIRSNSVIITCDAIDDKEKYKNIAAADLVNNLLLELSKDHAVFFAAYRLSNANVKDIFDPMVILDQAEILLDPFHTFFHLCEAKIEVANTFWAAECALYFFEKNVKWTDFLASSSIEDTKRAKLMKIGKLRGYFQVLDNSEYLLECGRDYEDRLKIFAEDMEKTGYVVKRGSG